MLVMILEKLLKSRWLVLSLLVGLITAVALVSSIPMYTDGILQRMLIQDLEAYQQKTGGTFWCMYGQTETSCLATFARYDERPGSAGRTLPLALVQIVDEANDEIVYTLRINGAIFRPKVFRNGTYTIKIGEGDNIKILKNVNSIGLDEDEVIRVSL